MKGILRSLEAVIATTIVMVTYILLFTSNPSPPEFETINWKLQGFYALQTLDNENLLRSSVVADNVTALTNYLTPLMPADLNFQVQICSTSCTVPSISASKIASISYLVAGNLTNYKPSQVILYMWST